jgi:hypothetical protein
MDKIDAAVHRLYTALRTGHTAWVNYSSLDHARSQLWFNLHKLIRALQAEHYRRLSLEPSAKPQIEKVIHRCRKKS